MLTNEVKTSSEEDSDSQAVSIDQPWANKHQQRRRYLIRRGNVSKVTSAKKVVMIGRVCIDCFLSRNILIRAHGSIDWLMGVERKMQLSTNHKHDRHHIDHQRRRLVVLGGRLFDRSVREPRHVVYKRRRREQGQHQPPPSIQHPSLRFDWETAYLHEIDAFSQIDTRWLKWKIWKYSPPIENVLEDFLANRSTFSSSSLSFSDGWCCLSILICD